MDNDPDPVLTALRKLREGAGLTTDRLARSGALMSALGTSDPEAGRRRLIEAIAGLEDTERSRTLRLDLGLDFGDLVGREAAIREREWLGDRRSAYAEAIGRDVKTLARWSDRAVAELRGHLIADSFNGYLYVVATVEGDRIVGTSLIQEPLGVAEQGEIKRNSLGLDNSASEPSMPCLIYAYPRDWRPASLTLVVVFRTAPYPAHIWGTFADNMLKLPFGEKRYELRLSGDTATCKFVKPRRDQVYGVWWS